MLILKRPFSQKIIAHTQTAYPLEACGLLGGANGIVTSQYPIHNRLQSETAYEMEPAEMLDAFLTMEAHGEELIAIYHSHPQGPPQPSPTDIAQAHYPDAVQIIVSLQERKRPLLRAFNIKNGRVSPITIAPL